MLKRLLWLVILVLGAQTAAVPAPTLFPWPAVAQRMVDALGVERGERVMLRFDPHTMRELESELARQLRAAGASVKSHPFGPLDDFAARLEETDIYVWLPEGPSADTPPGQMADLERWLDARQARRELHFHWV